MSRLNRDVLYLIFEELQNDRKTVYSCLSVNKTWCKIIIPILWKNPWKYLKRGKEKSLLDVIISHLPDKSRVNLSLGTNSLTYLFRPILDYVSFCKHLNLNKIQKIIDIIYINAKSKIPIITNEILNLFINKNTKFTHLYIPYQFNYQIHLIPGAKRCFSKLEFLQCSTSIEDRALNGLLELCKSIRALELYIERDDNNHEIVKLIRIPKKLHDVRLLTRNGMNVINESFYKILEHSLIKHANTIQSFKITKPVTKILSSFENLESLEFINDSYYNTKWNYLIENLSLPFLQNLKVRGVSINSITCLIENSSGSLSEINIDDIPHDDDNNKRIIQAIYQKCPSLKYLKLIFLNNNLLELENLLINCKYLSGLVIKTVLAEYNWDNLFEILVKSSPTGLFKFKIYSVKLFDKLKPLELFLDNWKRRHPMLLQIIPKCSHIITNNLIRKYKAEGIIKKFDHDSFGLDFEDFEWIQKKI